MAHRSKSLSRDDGWLTPRSRTQARNDFVVIQLGTTGTIEEVTVDVEHFEGRYENEDR